MRRITPAQARPPLLDDLDIPPRWFDAREVRPALRLPPDPPDWRLGLKRAAVAFAVGLAVVTFAFLISLIGSPQ